MQENVRDAVFGNVGTTISFRVSADDAPILSKQFEPQFEPADLLQMHNRNFVINMVIKGEKAPAFSASTLKLPTPQTDYFTYIVDHSRQLYSRDRADVEREIQQLVAPRITLQSQNGDLSRISPVDNATKAPGTRPTPVGQGVPTVAKPMSLQSVLLSSPVTEATTDKPKRKRTRNRSRNKNNNEVNSPQAGTRNVDRETPVSSRPVKPDETDIRIHH